MKILTNKNGEVLSIAMIFIAIVIIIFTFIIAIFMNHINSILYNFKLDMYALNRSAIIAINKLEGSIDAFSYDEEVYREEFLKNLKSNYSLDDNLKNNDKLISGVEIIEYTIYEDNDKDSYTNERCDGRVLHTVVNVRIKPIILKSILERLFTFEIHEDVALNSVLIY